MERTNPLEQKTNTKRWGQHDRDLGSTSDPWSETPLSQLSQQGRSLTPHALPGNAKSSIRWTAVFFCLLVGLPGLLRADDALSPEDDVDPATGESRAIVETARPGNGAKGEVPPGEKEALSHKSPYVLFPWTTLKAKVLKVDDGDSIVVDIYTPEGKLYARNEDIRLTGFDSPETHMEYKREIGGTVKFYRQSQIGGEEAAEFMKTLLQPGDEIEIVIPDVSKTGKHWYKTYAKYQRCIYGRLLGMIFVQRGGKKVFIQEAMARAGQGYYYHYLPVDPTKEGVFPEEHFERIRKAAIAAQAEGLGIWQPAPGGVTRLLPHEFRRIARNNSTMPFVANPRSKEFVSLPYIRVFGKDVAGAVNVATFKDAIDLGYTYRIVEPTEASRLLPKSLTDLVETHEFEPENPDKVGWYEEGVLKPRTSYKVKIVRILDGDTVAVKIAGKKPMKWSGDGTQ